MPYCISDYLNQERKHLALQTDFQYSWRRTEVFGATALMSYIFFFDITAH